MSWDVFNTSHFTSINKESAIDETGCHSTCNGHPHGDSGLHQHYDLSQFILHIKLPWY